MKNLLLTIIICCLGQTFVGCNDKEEIGILRDIEFQIDGENIDLSGTEFKDDRILYIYDNKGNKYANYKAYTRLSLDNGKYKLLAAMPLDSGMPNGNLNDIVIPLPKLANKKITITDPIRVDLPKDETVTFNLKTRTGTLVIQSQDIKSDRRYNFIDIKTKVYQSGYKPSTQTYVDGEIDIYRTFSATGGGVNFKQELNLYPTKDENDKIDLYFDFYNRSPNDTVLVKSQKLAQALSIEAGRTDTIKIFLNNTDEYINQNFKISSSYDEWTEETIKPTIIPSGYTMLSPDDNIANVIKKMTNDKEVEEIKLYLPAGTTFPTSLGRLTLTKSISLLAEEEANKRVTITTGNMSFNGPNIEFVHFEGIDFITTDNNLIVDVSGGSFNIEDFSLINCSVNNMGRGLIRFSGGGSDYNIQNFTIDNCTFTPWAKNGYSFIISQNEANFYHNFRMTNSTSYAAPGSNKTLFEGISDKITSNINIFIENCTFASNNSSYSLFDIRPGGEASFTLRKCLFTAGDNLNPNYGLRKNSSNISLIIEDNYSTEGWITNRDHLSPPPMEAESKHNLFRDYNNYDLTIINESSLVYKNKIGDPRWIK